MIRRHVLERGGAEKTFTVEFTAVEDHLREACIIDDGRHQPASAGFPLGVREALTLTFDQNRVTGQRLCHQRAFFRRVEHEFRVHHAERIKDVLLHEMI